MGIRRSPRLRRWLLIASLSLFGLLGAIRLAAADPVLWGWVAIVAFATAVLVGPVSWLVRDRFSDDRRKRLAVVTFGVIMLCIPIVLGLGLLVGGLLHLLDVGVLGGLIGLVVTTILERTLVPEELRGTDG